MQKYSVKLGVVPTRRFIFSKDDALKFKDLTYRRLKELCVDYVDIEDINDEGLFYSEDYIEAIMEKMRENKVDALFFPHCNFGTFAAARKFLMPRSKLESCNVSFGMYVKGTLKRLSTLPVANSPH